MNDYSIRVISSVVDLLKCLTTTFSSVSDNSQQYTSLIIESPTIAVTNLFWSFLFLLFLGALFLFSFEVFALLVFLSLTTLSIPVDKILLASRTFPEFSDNNSKLSEVEIGLVNDVLMFDANSLGIMKGSVWIFVFLSKLPVFTVFWITFWFSSKVWMMQFLVLHSCRR